MTKTTFRFRDGRGAVPAHRHKNASGQTGGWVADTADVHETAYVGPDARVYGNAIVEAWAGIHGSARVTGHVGKNAWVGGRSRIDGRVAAWARVRDITVPAGTCVKKGTSK